MIDKLAIKSSLWPAIAAQLSARPFRPHPLAKSGHAQTLIGYLYPRRGRLVREHLSDEKRLFEVAPGVQLLALCRWQNNAQHNHPTMLLVHGLEGSSNSVYMLGTAAKAFQAGFNVVRLNLRTCGATENLTKTLYHSGMSQDVRAVVKELIERDGFENVFLVGFSLGGNMILKLAGEFGENAPKELRGVCAVSPSIDLAASAAAIGKRSNWLYNQKFISSLKQRMRRIDRLYPDIYDIKQLASVRTIYDFDQNFTARYGGFKDVDDYYARSSSLLLIEQIRTPTLIIHAADDPFVPINSFRQAALATNSFVVLLTPAHGGHVGFVAADKQSDNDCFWAENRVVEFCRLIMS